MTVPRPSLAELVGQRGASPPVTAMERWTAANRELARCQQQEDLARERHAAAAGELAAARARTDAARKALLARITESRDESRRKTAESVLRAEESRREHEEWMRERASGTPGQENTR